MVSARLHLDPASSLISAAPPEARTIVITTAASSPELRAGLARHADVIVAGEETVDLKAALSALAERGHQRLLTEGGPHLFGQLVAADLVDELCLTISPLLTGDVGGRIVSGSLVPDHPLPLALAHLIDADGLLLCRYTRVRGAGRGG